MRIFNCNKLKWDKKSLIAYFIVIIASIICGIVLFKLNNLSYYIYQFADNYVFFVFNFKNSSLFFSRFLGELFYLYVVFLLAYFTKLKFLAYPILFFKLLFSVLYSISLCVFFGAEGIIVAIIVFIPSTLFSIVTFILITEQCKQLCTPLVYACPAILALINSIILMLLVNLVFRVIVIIV